MMKRFLAYTVAALAFLLAGGTALHAQDIIIVGGKVLNKNNGKPLEEVVTVYSYNTVAEAEDGYKSLMDAIHLGTVFTAGVVRETFTDNSGYYEIPVPETGALLFYYPLSDPVLEKVNRRKEIFVNFDVNVTIEATTITATRTSVEPDIEDTSIEGNDLKCKLTFNLPPHMGKTNARLIIQPYVLAANQKDTIEFRTPLVFDGEEYHLTQARRMGWDYDPLFQYVQDSVLTDREMQIPWEDNIHLADPSTVCSVHYMMSLEDYTNVYYNYEKLIISTDRIRRPLKFLEYSVEHVELDPMKYQEKAQRERRNASMDMSLAFLVGKAELDPDDAKSQADMRELKRQIYEIVHGEGSTLNEFEISGMASPDGPYAKNLVLAQERMNSVLKEVEKMVPADKWKRVYKPKPKARVASWTEVADLLEQDGYTDEAIEIKAIVARHYGKPDKQWEKIIKLDYYRPLVVSYLPKLRSVKCSYKSEVYRPLTPQEILDKYRNDSLYYNGKKPMLLYEYWNLFQMIEDKEELERLYKRAYEESKLSLKKPWMLAANNLAVSYLERGHVDTTVLAPFIDITVHGSNVTRTFNDGIRQTSELINPAELVVNQLIMYLRDNNFRSASIMAKLLPDTDEYKMVKAFTMCLGGHYKTRRDASQEDKLRANEVFELVRDSSPVNKVVMNLALKNRGNDEAARKAVEELDPNDPLTSYFKTILISRKADILDFGDEMEAIAHLKTCFYKDEKYIAIAAGDSDINKYVFEFALEEYKLEKEAL